MSTYYNANGSGGYISEQRYASAKCRIDIAKSYLCDAKRHFKKGDYIAMLSYMHCAIQQASRAMLELNEACDENEYIHTRLFSRDNLLFRNKIAYVLEKIVRGDFFRWPKESFSEDLNKTSIFIKDAEEVLSDYYICTDKEIEK